MEEVVKKYFYGNAPILFSEKAEIFKLLESFKKYKHTPIEGQMSHHAGDLFEHSLWSEIQIQTWYNENAEITSGCCFLLALGGAILHDIGKGGDCIFDIYEKGKYGSDLPDTYHATKGGMYINGDAKYQLDCNNGNVVNLDIKKLLKELHISDFKNELRVILYLHTDFCLNLMCHQSDDFVKKTNHYIDNFIKTCEECDAKISYELLCTLILVSCADLAGASNDNLTKTPFQSITGFACPLKKKYKNKNRWNIDLATKTRFQVLKSYNDQPKGVKQNEDFSKYLYKNTIINLSLDKHKTIPVPVITVDADEEFFRGYTSKRYAPYCDQSESLPTDDDVKYLKTELPCFFGSYENAIRYGSPGSHLQYSIINPAHDKESRFELQEQELKGTLLPFAFKEIKNSRLAQYKTKKKLTLLNISSSDTLKALKTMLTNINFENEEQQKLFLNWKKEKDGEPIVPVIPKDPKARYPGSIKTYGEKYEMAFKNYESILRRKAIEQVYNEMKFEKSLNEIRDNHEFAFFFEKFSRFDDWEFQAYLEGVSNFLEPFTKLDYDVTGDNFLDVYLNPKRTSKYESDYAFATWLCKFNNIDGWIYVKGTSGGLADNFSSEIVVCNAKEKFEYVKDIVDDSAIALKSNPILPTFEDLFKKNRTQIEDIFKAIDNSEITTRIYRTKDIITPQQFLTFANRSPCYTILDRSVRKPHLVCIQTLPKSFPVCQTSGSSGFQSKLDDDPQQLKDSLMPLYFVFPSGKVPEIPLYGIPDIKLFYVKSKNLRNELVMKNDFERVKFADWCVV